MATIESPVAEGRNSLPYLVPCLQSHAPVDLLVIYLGTNDAQWLEPDMVALSVGRLVKAARVSDAGPPGSTPAVLVVCPPPFGGHELGPAFREVCDVFDCELLDLDGVLTYSAIDDIHLDSEGHIALAEAVEERARGMLGLTDESAEA
jgi:lysophospholipase L1-like esterase